MDISSLTGLTAASGSATTAVNDYSAFREADFMQILLAEVTNQDPMEPMEMHKMVDGMRQLLELSNQRFENFRNDLRWAQELVGKEVIVGQAKLEPSEARALHERGLRPDVGYGTVTGSIETYRVVDEKVWVTIDGQDYPIDNVQKISPPGFDPAYAADLAGTLLGRTVSWSTADGGVASGLVTDLAWDDAGTVTLSVGDQEVPFTAVTRIGESG